MGLKNRLATLPKKGKNSSLSLNDKLVIEPVNTREEIAKELGKSTGYVAKADYVKKGVGKNYPPVITAETLAKKFNVSDKARALGVKLPPSARDNK